MGCVRTNLRASRLKKKYPLVRNVPQPTYVASTGVGVENLIIYVDNADVAVVTFDTPFPGIPSVVASFKSTSPVGNVNVFIETASPSGVTIRTSAPTTGFISIHAMYIEGCDVPDYTFAPVILSPPVLGPAVGGNNLTLTPPNVIGNPAP